MTADEWARTLTYEKMEELSYASYCISETLRLDPPLQMSSPCYFKEPVEMGGY